MENISIIKNEDNEINMKKINKNIFNTLTMIGLKTSNKGFRYIQKAIEMAIIDPESINLITKTIYIDIAKLYNTSWTSVERAMRIAISNIEYTPYGESIFHCKNIDKYGKYTNKEFITYIAQYIIWNFE